MRPNGTSSTGWPTARFFAALLLVAWIPSGAAAAETAGKVTIATVVLKNNEGTVTGKVLAYKTGAYIKLETRRGTARTLLAENIKSLTFTTMSASKWSTSPEPTDSGAGNQPPPVTPPAPRPPKKEAAPQTPPPIVPPGGTKAKKTPGSRDIVLPDDDDDNAPKRVSPRPKTSEQETPGEHDQFVGDVPATSLNVLTPEQKKRFEALAKWRRYSETRLIFKGSFKLGLSQDSDFNNSLGGCSSEEYYNGVLGLGLELDYAMKLPPEGDGDGWHSLYISGTVGTGMGFMDERIRSCGSCDVACGTEIDDTYGWQFGSLAVELSAGFRLGFGKMDKDRARWEGVRIGLGLTMNASQLGFHFLGLKADLEFITNDITRTDRDFFWRYTASWYPSLGQLPQYFLLGVEVLWF